MVRCPTAIALELFMTGDCTSAESQRIMLHAADCVTCSSWIADSAADEELLADLRCALPAGKDEAPPEFERYQTVRCIGRGSSGEVWEGVQERPERRVALKVLRGGALTSARRARFELEAELLARLDHPGIARILEAGTCQVAGGERPFLAMELVDGAPLTAHARAAGLGRRERLELFARICDAVQHAHQKGVVHRDLKPSNVLVTADGTPKVVDFGVARPLQGGAGTIAGQVIGTLAYMAPEQVRGDEIDTRADVYALGGLMYELLAGQRALEVEGIPLTEAARRIEDAVPARLGTIDRSLAGDLEAIAAHGLEKDRQRRYASAAALGSDVRRHLAGDPVEVRAPSAFYQLSRLARKNKVASVLALLLLFSLVAGIVVTNSQLGRAQAEARKYDLVRGFLQSVLIQASPTEGEVKAPTLREALDVAARRVETELENEPAVELVVRSTIGSAYLGIAAVDAARPHVERAVELSAALHGEQTVEHLEQVKILGELTRKGGRYVEAEEVLHGALAAVEEAGPEAALLHFALLVELAWALYSQARFDEAEQYVREALDRASELAGGDPSMRVVAMHLLADVLVGAQRPDEALELNRAALDVLADIDGPRAAVLRARSRVRLAGVLLKRRQFDEARDLIEPAVEELTALFGPEHPHVFEARVTHARLVRDRGEPAAAVPLFEELVAARRAHYGADNEHIAASLADLSSALWQAGEPERAEEELRASIDASSSSVGDTHLLTIDSLGHLGLVLRLKKSLEDSRETLGRRYAAAEQVFGADDRRLIDAQVEYGVALGLTERWAEAELYLLAAYEGLERTLGREHEKTRAIARHLGRAYTELSQADKAAQFRTAGGG